MAKRLGFQIQEPFTERPSEVAIDSLGEVKEGRTPAFCAVSHTKRKEA